MSVEFNTDNVEINSISIKNATVDNNTELRKLEKGLYEHELTFSFIPGISQKENKLRLIFGCEIKTFSTPNETERNQINIVSKFEIEYYYIIKNFEQYVSRENNKIMPDLLVAISSLAYSTSRGIIFAKCQGTLLSNVILPVMPNNQLVELLTDEE